MKDHPEGFSRIAEIFHDWFGKRWNQHRVIIPVLAINSVLTIEMKDRIFAARGNSGVQMLDAVDILCAEFTPARHRCRRRECTVY